MAIFHLHTQPIGRGQGRSAVACAAYRAGDLLRDDRQGLAHDYTRKQGVLYAEILTPDNAPTWAQGRETLWNAAEFVEKRKDARLAREIEIALPHELTDAQRLKLARQFARELVDRYGVAVDMAFHAPHRDGDDRNHHAHLLMTTRQLDAEGFTDKGDLELSERDLSKRGLPSGKEQIKALRQQWADRVNRELERNGLETRIDPRSLEAQGIDREATQHRGPAATEMERSGRETRIGEENREREKRNRARQALKAERDRTEAEALERWMQEEQAREEALQAWIENTKAKTAARAAVQQTKHDDHAAVRETEGREAQERTAEDWTRTLDGRKETREGFKDARDEITDRTEDGDHAKGKDRAEGGNLADTEPTAPRTTAEIAGDYIRLCQNPLRDLRGWLDADGRAGGESDLLPSRPLPDMGTNDGLRPVREEAGEERLDDPRAAFRQASDETTDRHPEERPNDAPEKPKETEHERKALEEDEARAERMAQFRRMREEAERKRLEAIQRELEKAKENLRERGRDQGRMRDF
jgi:hypothetical protein